MGFASGILGVGKFKKDIVSCLNYQESVYDNVEDGTLMITELFVCSGSTQSSEVASCIGVDPWDFNTHRIQYDNIDSNKLVSVLGDEGKKLMSCINKLHNARFILFFMLNG